MSKRYMSDREHAAILAGLRCWQALKARKAPDVSALYSVATNCGEFFALSVNEIDRLCEDLNTCNLQFPPTWERD